MDHVSTRRRLSAGRNTHEHGVGDLEEEDVGGRTKDVKAYYNVYVGSEYLHLPRVYLAIHRKGKLAFFILYLYPTRLTQVPPYRFTHWVCPLPWKITVRDTFSSKTHRDDDLLSRLGFILVPHYGCSGGEGCPDEHQESTNRRRHRHCIGN